MSYAKGFGWNLAFNFVAKLVTPIVALLIMRRLSPNVFGMYAILQAALMVADAVRDAGVAQVYLKETREDVEPTYVAMAVRLGLGLGVALAFLAWPAAAFYGRPELAAGLGFTAAAMALNGLSTVPYVKLLRRGDFRRAGQAETLASVASSLYALAAVHLGLGFLALATQLVLRALLFLSITQVWAPTKLRWRGPAVEQRTARTSRTLTAVNLLWTGYFMADQAVVGKLIGLTAGGLYGSGKMFVQTADVLAKPIMQTANVAFAHRSADPDAIGRTLHKSLAAFLLGVAPIYVGVALFAEPLVRTLLPASYHATASVLPALCFYGAAIYPGSFGGSALLMIDRPDVALRSWIAVAVLVAAILFAAGSALSLVGVAWLFAIGLALVNTVTLAVALARFRPDAEARANLFRGVASVLVVAGIAAVLARAPLSDALRLGLAVLILPLAHVIMVGSLTVRRPFALFHPAGIREVWSRL